MIELRLMIFLGELNNLELFGADIRNAYLKAKTKEKVYFIANKGFGELEGHTMGIYKALYGLKTSGKCWYKRMADVLKDMGFQDVKNWTRNLDARLLQSLQIYCRVHQQLGNCVQGSSRTDQYVT